MGTTFPKASASESAAADYIKPLKDAGFRLTKLEGNVVVNFEPSTAKKGEYAGKDVVPQLVVYEDGKMSYRLKVGTKAVAAGSPVTKAGITRQLTILLDRAKTAGYTKPVALGKMLTQAVQIITTKPEKSRKETVVKAPPKVVFKVALDQAKHTITFTSKQGTIVAARGKTPGTWELRFDGDIDRATARKAVSIFLDADGKTDEVSVSSASWMVTLRQDLGPALYQFRATSLTFQQHKFDALVLQVPNETSAVLTKSTLDRKMRELGYDIKLHTSSDKNSLASVYNKDDSKLTLRAALEGANSMLIMADYEDMKP